MESDSVTLSQRNLNVESRYFEDKLKSLRINNINRIIKGQININSIRTKFDDLVKGVRGNIDILMISEEKLRKQYLKQYLSIQIRSKWQSWWNFNLYPRGYTIKAYYSQSFKCRRFFLRIKPEKKGMGFFLFI